MIYGFDLAALAACPKVVTVTDLVPVFGKHDHTIIRYIREGLLPAEKRRMTYASGYRYELDREEVGKSVSLLAASLGCEPRREDIDRRRAGKGGRR